MQEDGSGVPLSSYIRSTNLEIKAFPHPKAAGDNDAVPLMLYVPPAAGNATKKSGDIYELQTVQLRRNGSWFSNQRVSSSSVFFMTSKIDPRFLCLPFLQKSRDKFSPLDQIIGHTKDCERLPIAHASEWKMDEICDIKDLGDDAIFYRYNEEKTLAWLKAKVARTAITLAKQKALRGKRVNRLMASNFNVGTQSTKLKYSETTSEGMLR